MEIDCGGFYPCGTNQLANQHSIGSQASGINSHQSRTNGFLLAIRCSRSASRVPTAPTSRSTGASQTINMVHLPGVFYMGKGPIQTLFRFPSRKR
jgi:hypothetical protein